MSLKAPISGYIVWVNPELREGAELPPMAAALLWG